MLNSKVHKRISSYEEISDIKLTPKLPVVIIINGRSFSRLTSNIEKPFSSDFMEIMTGTLIKLCKEIEGACFGYTFNDELIIIARNDQNIETEPWYENRVQKISSVAASVATLSFVDVYDTININLFGDPVFSASSFVVPSVTEAINTLVSKQQQAFQTAVSLAVYQELTKIYDVGTVKDILDGKSIEEKIELLNKECKIDFNQYPVSFKRGAACYRAPKVFSSESGNIIKDKWTIDTEIPIFTKDHTFLGNIFKSGRDIFRANRDM